MNALVLIDLQNDFLPGGTLAVPDGDAVIPVANRLQTSFDLIVASQDWHPRDHVSFAANHPGKKVGDVLDLSDGPQILWPIHCVQNTPGAAFSPRLETDRIACIFQKGVDPEINSYSAFFDNARRRSTGLGEFLGERGLSRVYLMGLATDYCVKFSVLDAIHFGFEVHLIEDGCRDVNLKRGDGEAAIESMRKAGATIVRSSALETGN